MNKQEAEKLYLHWQSNLGDFVEDILTEHLTCETPSFHKEIFELLSTTNRLVLAAPRGFGKSVVCSVFYPLWCALFERKRDICIISASEGLAIEWLRKIRNELEVNPKINSFWGDLKSSKWTENHIILKNGVNIRARGAEAQIRGFRPDLIVLDDIETDDSVASEDRRNKLRDWIFKSCFNTLPPSGQLVWIGTIISFNALLEEQLGLQNGWAKRRYAAYKDCVEEPGNEIWAELWSHDRLQKRKKEIGSSAFCSEYLNNPVSNDKAPIKQYQVRNWIEFPKQYNAVIAVDPAYSEEERSDYKTAVLIGVDSNSNRYLLTYIRTHSPSGEFIDAVLNLYLHNKNNVTAIGIPNGGTEKEFFNSFCRKAEERRLYPPIMEVQNAFTQTGTNRTYRRKIDRIVAALQPLFESGKYYIHESHGEARDELLTLGFSKHDDIVDAMCYAEQLIQPPSTEYNYPERGRYGEPLESEIIEFTNNYGLEY